MGRLYDFPFLQECTASSLRISGRRSIGAGASLHFRRGSGVSLTSPAPSRRLRGAFKTIIINFFSLSPPLLCIQSCPYAVYGYIFSIFIHGFPHLSLVDIRFRHYNASGIRPPSSEPFRGFNQVRICLVLGLSFSLDNMSFFLSAPPSFPPFFLFLSY